MQYGIKYFECDVTTAIADYTNDMLDAITQEIFDWFLTAFQLEIMTDKTEETESLGHIYYLTKSGNSYPMLKIWWYNASSQLKLLASYMFENIVLSTGYSDATYVKVLRYVSVSSSYKYQGYWYAVSSNNAMIGQIVNSATAPISANKDVKLLSNFNTDSIYCRYSDNSLLTYDVYKNFDPYSLMSYSTDIKYITSRIGNANKDYICPLSDANGLEVKGLYVATKYYAAGKIMKLNGSLYLCLMSSSSYLSILMKLE